MNIFVCSVVSYFSQESAGLGSSFLQDFAELRKKRAGGRQGFYNTVLSIFCLIVLYKVDPDLNTCTVAVVADYNFFSSVGNSQESTVSCHFCLKSICQLALFSLYRRLMR